MSGGVPAEGGAGAPAGRAPAEGGAGAPAGGAPAEGGAGAPAGGTPAEGGAGAPVGGTPAEGGAGAPAGGTPAEGGAGAPAGPVEEGTGIVAWEVLVAVTVPAIGTTFAALSSDLEHAVAMRSTVEMRDIVLVLVTNEFLPMLDAGA